MRSNPKFVKTRQTIWHGGFDPWPFEHAKCKVDNWYLCNYIMDVTDALGLPSFYIIFLSVILRRRIAMTPPTCAVRVTEQVCKHCVVSGTPERAILWFAHWRVSYVKMTTLRWPLGLIYLCTPVLHHIESSWPACFTIQMLFIIFLPWGSRIWKIFVYSTNCVY